MKVCASRVHGGFWPKVQLFRNLPRAPGLFRGKVSAACQFLLLALAMVMAATTAQAQQRVIVNPSFENFNATGGPVTQGGTPPPDATAQFTIAADDWFPGWISSIGRMEVVRTNGSFFNNTPAQQGTYFAELNPDVPINLYQDVCLINGEQLSWSFYHHFRPGGSVSTQTLFYQVQDSSGSPIQTLDTSAVSAATPGWQQNTGTVTYTGPTGLQRLAFGTNDPGSFGNFLDNITIDLVPLVEVTVPSTTSDLEASGGNTPTISISGTATSPVTVNLSVTGGTATAGTDFTLPASLVIPTGTYPQGSTVPIPLTIIDDAVVEPDETIEIMVSSVSSNAVIGSSQSCGAVPNTTAAYTILNDDVNLIDAVDDAPTAQNGASGGTTPESVLDNDTLNGVAVVPADVTLTPGTAPTPTAGAITMNPDGTITVAPGTTAGTYSYDYTICEVLNPTNCDTAVATVVVNSPAIDAVDDAPTAQNGASGGTTPESVLDNDTLNGVAVVPADVTLTPGTAPTPTAGAITMNPDGTITVAPGTTAGTYSYDYTICEVLNPANCDTAVATVVVNSSAIDAADDSPTAQNGASGGTTPESVLDNDTLNGVAVVPADITLTPGTAPTPPAGAITMNPDGTITVAPGTTAGTYSYDYTICEVLNPANCDTAVATVVVDASPIEGVDETPPAIDDVSGGTTPSVLDNATLNGTTVNPADITLSSSGSASDGVTALGLASVPANGSITIDPTGQILVAAGTTAGTYTYTYEICENLNPTNCSIAQATIVVNGVNLLDLIQDDLETILEDDLLVTLTQQSAQMNSYAQGARDRLRDRAPQRCLAAVNATLDRENIRFDTDRAVIKSESYPVLDEIAEILGTCEGEAFEIAGHTDSDASAEYNQRLSQRRVETVVRSLAARGVNMDGYVARGYGETQPIAGNDTEIGKAQNRRVEFRALSGDVYEEQCKTESNLTRAVDLTANGDGTTVDGYLHKETRDCRNDAWTIFEGGLSYLETDSGQAQTMLNLSYRREHFKDEDTVRGYFFGLYGTQNDITNLATGEITGVGINGGIYGANRLQNGLFLDYYLGAAAGRHSFDLDFARGIGIINATGDYNYVAAFVGAALSGETLIGDRVVSPRVGFDYTYAPGADVDVITRLNGIEQSGSFELNSVAGGRLFAEVRDERLIFNDDVILAVTPRVSCYQSLGDLGGVCGIGGSIEFINADEKDDLIYSLEIDGESGEGYSRLAARGSIIKHLRGSAVVNGNTGIDENGRIIVGAGIDWSF